MADMSFLTLLSLPFSFKFIWAPILDSYYIRSMGKRKTYIVIIQLIIAITLILITLNINSLINHLKINWLFIIGFFIVLCLTI